MAWARIASSVTPKSGVWAYPEVHSGSQIIQQIACISTSHQVSRCTGATSCNPHSSSNSSALGAAFNREEMEAEGGQGACLGVTRLVKEFKLQW